MNRTFLSTVVLGLAGVVLGACVTSSPVDQQGQAFYNAGNYLFAADAFTEDIRLHPRSASAWNNRAVARVRLGDLNGAVRDYNRAIELAPTDAELYFNRGNALVAAGQYQDAIMDYSRAIQINPTYARALYNRGTAYALAGQPDAARRDWLAAIELEPDPYAKSAMRRSAGLDRPTPAVATATPPGQSTTPFTVAQPVGQPTTAYPSAPPPAPGTRPGALPLPVAPPASAVASAASTQPAASPGGLDARAFTQRAISRELDGDHAGALQDLNAALAAEPDPARREAIGRLIRQLDAPR
jgi:tetratricopeptide (TPR) repeat protein